MAHNTKTNENVPPQICNYWKNHKSSYLPNSRYVSSVEINVLIKMEDWAGGALVKNPLANSGDTG